MTKAKYAPEEVVRRGKEIYDRDLRAKLEAGNHGKILVIDVETGAYGRMQEK